MQNTSQVYPPSHNLLTWNICASCYPVVAYLITSVHHFHTYIYKTNIDILKYLYKEYLYHFYAAFWNKPLML